MSLVFVVFCVGSGPYDALITLSEESYRVYFCPVVCDLETLSMRRSRPDLDRCVTKNLSVNLLTTFASVTLISKRRRILSWDHYYLQLLWSFGVL